MEKIEYQPWWVRTEEWSDLLVVQGFNKQKGLWNVAVRPQRSRLLPSLCSPQDWPQQSESTILNPEQRYFAWKWELWLAGQTLDSDTQVLMKLLKSFPSLTHKDNLTNRMVLFGTDWNFSKSFYTQIERIISMSLESEDRANPIRDSILKQTIKEENIRRNNIFDYWLLSALSHLATICQQKQTWRQLHNC